ISRDWRQEPSRRARCGPSKPGECDPRCIGQCQSLTESVPAGRSPVNTSAIPSAQNVPAGAPPTAGLGSLIRRGCPSQRERYLEATADERFELFLPDADSAPFDEGAQQIDTVRRREFLLNLGAYVWLVPSVDQEGAG